MNNLLDIITDMKKHFINKAFTSRYDLAFIRYKSEEKEYHVYTSFFSNNNDLFKPKWDKKTIDDFMEFFHMRTMNSINPGEVLTLVFSWDTDGDPFARVHISYKENGKRVMYVNFLK